MLVRNFSGASENDSWASTLQLQLAILKIDFLCTQIPVVHDSC